MATLTADRSALPARSSGLADNVKVAWGKIDLATNPTATDTWDLCKLPKNCAVIGGKLYAEDIDTNATETLDVDVGWTANGGAATFTSGDQTLTNSGNAADPDGFVNSGVLVGDGITELIPASANVRLFPMSTGPLFFSEETQVQAVANAAAATFAAGVVWVAIEYTMLS